MDVAQFTRSPTERHLGGFQVPFLFMAKFGLLHSVGNKDSDLLNQFSHPEDHVTPLLLVEVVCI